MGIMENAFAQVHYGEHIRSCAVGCLVMLCSKLLASSSSEQRAASSHHLRKIPVTSKRPKCSCSRCHPSMRLCSHSGCFVRLLPTFLGGNQGAFSVALNRIVENTP